MDKQSIPIPHKKSSLSNSGSLAYPLNQPPVTALDFQSRIQKLIQPSSKANFFKKLKYVRNVFGASTVILFTVVATVYLANVSFVDKKERQVKELILKRAHLLNEIEKLS